MSAGKLQRNPATGKLKRNPHSGKCKRNSATNTACCCDVTECETACWSISGTITVTSSSDSGICVDWASTLASYPAVYLTTTSCNQIGPSFPICVNFGTYNDDPREPQTCPQIGTLSQVNYIRLVIVCPTDDDPGSITAYMEAGPMDGTTFLPSTTEPLDGSGSYSLTFPGPGGVDHGLFTSFGGTVTVTALPTETCGNCGEYSAECHPISVPPPCPCPTFTFDTATEVKETCNDPTANIFTSSTAVVPADTGDSIAVDGTLDDILVMIGASESVTGSWDGVDTITYTIPDDAIFFTPTHGNFSAGSSFGGGDNAGDVGTCCETFIVTVTGTTNANGVYTMTWDTGYTDGFTGGHGWTGGTGNRLISVNAFGIDWNIQITGTLGDVTEWNNSGTGSACPPTGGSPSPWGLNFNNNGGTAIIDVQQGTGCGCWNKKVFKNASGTKSVTITSPTDTTTSISDFASAGFTVINFGDTITASTMSTNGWVDDTKCASFKFAFVVSGTGFAHVTSITCDDGMP